MNKTHTLVLTLFLALLGSTAFGQRTTDNPDQTMHVTVGGSVYGGGNLANVAGNSEVTINQAGAVVTGDVYGGGALAHVNVTTTTDENGVDSYSPTANTTTTVTLTKGNVGGSVYGGGLGRIATAAVTDPETGDVVTPAVDAVAALVYGPVTVNINGGTVTGSVYGCNNLNGAPQSTVGVTVNGGTVVTDVYGGGNLAAYTGDPVVTVNGGKVERDVYGGGALADVDGNTLVHILGGRIDRDIYGGGLGCKALPAVADDPETEDDESQPAVAAVAATVTGTATVNIGSGTPDGTDPFTEEVTGLSGSASIGGNVYGCNNANGSPQENVTVNIFQTAHTETDAASYTGAGADYAIANVFGGGNAADFTVTGKTAFVNIYTCANTIGRVFGGGNAAAAYHVETQIQGGRIGKVFGGGNGEVTGANINNGVHLTIHGGNIGEFYGGSNQSGTLNGDIDVKVVNDGPCTELEVSEFFCGGNFVEINGNLETTIDCSQGMEIHDLYGGCNQANIHGHVVLNLYGGIYTNVYGGSKGRLAQDAVGQEGDDDYQPAVPAIAADIDQYVTLNLYGGTIENVYGGSNINGNIKGLITVNVIDIEGECPLYITNIYGGSNETDYSPTYNPAPSAVRISPVVNIVHAKNGISGNVYGGSKGKEGATEEDMTKVEAHPLVNVGYNADMNSYLPSTYPAFIQNTLNNKPRAIIAGSVFGGGDAAKVVGDTKIMLRNRAKVFGNVYGGGNMGEVTGDTKVIVNGDNQ